MTAFLELDGLSVRLGRRDVLRDLRGALAGRSIGLLRLNFSTNRWLGTAIPIVESTVTNRSSHEFWLIADSVPSSMPIV